MKTLVNQTTTPPSIELCWRKILDTETDCI